MEKSTENKFDRRIVNQYVPETSPFYTSDLSGVTYAFKYRTRQIADFQLAIEWAEENILPAFKHDNLAKLDHNQLTSWLKQIHWITAKTLLIPHGVSSGEYTPLPVMRWQKTTAFHSDLLYFLINDVDLRQLLIKYDLNNEDGQRFIDILTKVKALNIKVPEHYMKGPYFNDKHEEAIRTLNKLSHAERQDLLTEKEKKSLKKIVKICLVPEDIPPAMEKFAKQLIKNMKECSNDMSSVAKLAANAYRELTEIHPFANGNGRVGVIFLNCVLMAFGYPSIVFREIQDKLDDNSEYNNVFKQIDEKPELLVAYIERKMQESLNREPQANLNHKYNSKLIVLNSLLDAEKLLEGSSKSSEDLFLLVSAASGDFGMIKALMTMKILPSDTKSLLNTFNSIINKLAALPSKYSLPILEHIKQVPFVTEKSDTTLYSVASSFSQLTKAAVSDVLEARQLQSIMTLATDHIKTTDEHLEDTKKAINFLCKSTAGLFKDHHALLINDVSQYTKTNKRCQNILGLIKNKEYNKALRNASVNGLSKLIDIICQYKHQLPIDVSEQAGASQNSALHWAIAKGHRETVNILLKHGASLKVKNSNEHTPSELAFETANNSSDNSAYQINTNMELELQRARLSVL